MRRRIRLAYLVSHPIQYQAPLLRRISQEPDIDLTVFFASNFSVREYVDKGFGVGVKWDVPLLDGYRHEFLPSIWDKDRTGPTSQLNCGIFSRLRGRKDAPGFDVLWVHGYSSVNAMQAMLAAKALGIPVLLRAESRLGGQERSGSSSVRQKRALLQRMLRGFRRWSSAHRRTSECGLLAALSWRTTFRSSRCPMRLTITTFRVAARRPLLRVASCCAN